MTEHPFIVSRRSFLVATGGAATLATFAAPREVRAATLSEAEKAVEKVVNDFCAAWETKDANKIESYLADDVTFQAIETSPVIEGRETLMEGFKKFLSSAKYVRFEMLRSMVIGKTVINDRVDSFDLGDNPRSAHISGFFFVVDGKIKEWRDYSLPAVD